MKKKQKKTLTYVEAHNKAVNRYKRSARILIWASIFSVIALLIGVIQLYSDSGNSSTLPTYFCYGAVELSFFLFASFSSLPPLGYIFIVIGISLVISIGMVFLSVEASQGKRKPLIISVGLYFIDWVIVIITEILFRPSTFLLTAGFHVIFSVILVIAIYEYFNVINIEKKYNNLQNEQEVVQTEAE